MHTKTTTYLLALLAFGPSCFSQSVGAPFSITLSKTTLAAGDTVEFEAVYLPWKNDGKSGTLNLFLEDVNHTSYWSLRYPLLQGEASGAIVLPTGIPSNTYALHCRLQDDFFNVTGRVVSSYRDNEVKATVMLNDQQLLSQPLQLNPDKSFAFKKMLFADQARFYFAPAKANRTNDLQIELQVSLDSAYVPLHDTTLFFAINSAVDPKVIATYQFTMSGMDGEGTLESVEVLGKKKTPIEKFEDDRVTGMFKSADAYAFDGNGSDQFMGWQNIIEWVRGRVPGMRVGQPQNGYNYDIQWQGSATQFFLNEMQVDAQTLATLPTADIAYVKVFRPPFYGAYLGGAGGAIAVYTKDGSNGRFGGPRNSFVVNGYTPSTFTLTVKEQ